MCIGEPLRVLRAEGTRAWCSADAAEPGTGEWLDMLLVGEQAAGTWVLAFQGAARQVLGDAEAAGMRAARRALAAVLQGASNVDDCFADLVGRTPQLPPHLRAAATP